ncbi:MAG: ABC transporter permease [Gemmatales bacterium]|nr:ABC transporter permease [Gemmatales bacterium]MCS7159944.1 ABC transporter permease [Gemmatales bacterium]MDW8175143.1 ABC transporter permease [Gemmatales bacterium]MDW8221654.1 ABC transporter permease [Gemmatales bacterium]
MIWVAFQMLTGDRAKYFGMLLGISFATLLIAQQSSIFCGLLLTASSQIYDAKDAPIWVMDPGMQFVDDIKPMSENELWRVRGVPGVAWAVRFYKGLGRARFGDGKFQQVMILGLDDAYMVGAPREMVLGKLEDLRQPDAVIMDERGYRFLWPGQPYTLGRTFEMNDRRAVLVGVCKASRTFQTFPILYTRFSQAVRFAPQERKALSFILAAPQPHLTAKEVALRIEERTKLKALTRDEFADVTIWYYLRRTGIPINFGTTVLLGFFVGTAIAGQTFYLFTVENLRQFGALKAMGVTNLRLVGMLLFQGLFVGIVGYGLGIGMAAGFGILSERSDRLSFYMPWQVMVGTGLAVLLIILLTSMVSLRRVLVLEPAQVFRA